MKYVPPFRCSKCGSTEFNATIKLTGSTVAVVGPGGEFASFDEIILANNMDGDNVAEVLKEPVCCRGCGLVIPFSDLHAPKPVLTPKEYVEFEGTLCPYCGSNDVEAGPFEVDGGHATSEASCNDCGADWIDQYELSGYMIQG